MILTRFVCKARLLSFFGKPRAFLSSLTEVTLHLAHWRFLYFHGQKNARLDKHQTVHDQPKRERTFFITLLSPMLFLAPEVHLREIEKLWTDEIIIDAAWKTFVPKLLEEWQELILLVCCRTTFRRASCRRCPSQPLCFQIGRAHV